MSVELRGWKRMKKGERGLVEGGRNTSKGLFTGLSGQIIGKNIKRR